MNINNKIIIVHCWAYYLWILEQGKISKESDLTFVTSQINANFSNYSAWHHRSVIFSTYSSNEIISNAKSEFEWLLNAFFTDPSDQSAWIYYRWLLNICNKSFNELEKKNEWIELVKEQFEMINELNEMQENEKWVMFTLIELHQVVKENEKDCELLDKKKIEEYLKKLEEIDKMRIGFYNEVEKDLDLMKV